MRRECDIDRGRQERECGGDSKGVKCGEDSVREKERQKMSDRVGERM